MRLCAHVPVCLCLTVTMGVCVCVCVSGCGCVWLWLCVVYVCVPVPVSCVPMPLAGSLCLCLCLSVLELLEEHIVTHPLHSRPSPSPLSSFLLLLFLALFSHSQRREALLDRKLPEEYRVALAKSLQDDLVNNV